MREHWQSPRPAALILSLLLALGLVLGGCGSDGASAEVCTATLAEDGSVVWEGEERTVYDAPPASFFMRAESWFFGLLPIESQM